MALRDLFTSKAEKEKQARLARRKAFREAERVVDSVNTDIARMRDERDKLWDQAKVYKLNGQKMAVQRTLKSYRAQEMHISTMEMKQWGFRQILTRMRSAETDQAFAGALQGLNAIQFASPESLENTLEEIGLKLDEFGDNNAIWTSMYNKEMADAEMTHGAAIPSMDELEAFLEDEVIIERNDPVGTVVHPSAGLVKTNITTSVVTETVRPELQEKIGAARERLNRLLKEAK